MMQASKFVDEILENNIIGWFHLESRETESYTFQHNGYIWSARNKCSKQETNVYQP